MPVIYHCQPQGVHSSSMTYLLSNVFHMSDNEVVALGVVQDGETPWVLEGHEM